VWWDLTRHLIGWMGAAGGGSGGATLQFRRVLTGRPLLVQLFSQKSRTPTVAKYFQIGLYDPAVADLDLFCNS